jgi:excisionase family DNA binding protein
MTPLQNLLATGDAAKHIGVSPGTVRRWAKTGQLRHVVMPSGRLRFRREDLDAALTHVEVGTGDAA